MSVHRWAAARHHAAGGLTRLLTVFLVLALAAQYGAAVGTPVAAVAIQPLADAAVAPQAATAGCGTYPLDVELLIDTSGSMGSNQSSGHTRLYWAQQAADQLIDDLDANGGVGGANGLNQLGISQFHGTAGHTGAVTTLVTLGSHGSASTMTSAVDGLSADGNTPLKAGLARAAADMTAGQRATFQGNSVTHVLILLSDGAPNPDQTDSHGDPSHWGDWATSSSSQRPQAADGAAYLGTSDVSFTVAVGNANGEGVQSVDLGLMGLLAKPNDTTHALHITDASGLPDIFASIFKEIACQPKVTTQAAPATATAGTSVSVGDTATVSGGSDPTGNVSFTLYSDAACKTAVSGMSGQGAISGSTASWSKAWLPVVGTYTWGVSYDGDTNNLGFTSCGAKDGSETLTVTRATPSMTTQASAATVSMGDAVSDAASLSGVGSIAPSGSVAFYVCGPTASAAACSSTAHQVGSAVAVTTNGSAGSATSASFTPSALGAWCFYAVYTPDQAAAATYAGADHSDSTHECVNVLGADLVLTKTADKTSVSAGQQIGFQLTIKNDGQGTAHGVKVSDPLPTGSGLSWSIDGSAAGWSIASGSLSFGGTNGVDLASGASASVHIVSPTTAATCGLVQNSATSSSSNDGHPDASASVSVLCPNLGLIKTAGASAVSAGDRISFTLSLSNAGPGHAADASVDDPLPAGTGILWSIQSPVSGWSLSGSAGNQVLSFAAADFGPGSTQVTVVSATDKSSCASYSNTATADAANDPAQPVQASASTSVQCGALLLTKTAASASVDAGDPISYTLTVTNGGQGTIADASASDTLPTGSGLSWSISHQDGGWSLSGGLLSFAAASFGPGATSSVTITSPTALQSCGTVQNSASASGDDTDSVEVGPVAIAVDCPDLAVSKTVDKATAQPGQTLHYTITLTNAGSGAARGIAVSDDLSPLLAHGTYDGDADHGGSFSSPTLSWSGLVVPAGGQLQLTYSVTLAQDGWAVGATDLPNTVVVTGLPNECEAGSDDPDCSTNTTVTIPRIGIAKTLTGGNTAGTSEEVPVAQIGDTLTYTLTFSVTDGPVVGATVSDTIPAGLQYVAGSASDRGTISADGSTLSWSFASLADGQQVTYQVVVLDSAGGQDQPIVNTATVVAPDTNCAAGSSDPSCSSSADVTVLIVLPASPTPSPSSTPSPSPSATPGHTLPATDAAPGAGGTGQGGSPLLPLMLIALIGLAGGIRLMTPAPARARARDERR